jgi:hypothetical protein
MAADLLTLAEYKTAAGIGVTDTRQDAKITQWIPWMSQAIRAFTERDFGAGSVTEERIYEYDGSGYLDIDDAATITAVSFTYISAPDIVLSVDEWAAKPERRDDAPVYQWILLPGYAGGMYGSPEMGFTRNLDVFYRENRNWPLPSKVKVNGTWGWPVIPGDIKMAAVWTMQEWISRPSGEGLTAEAIEGWSRTWGTKAGGSAAALAIPERARDILANYARITI